MWLCVPLVLVYLVRLKKKVILVLDFLASAAFPSTCDTCLRFRSCPVVLDIELTVSAGYQKPRALLRARLLLLLLLAAVLVAAAACGGVRQNFQNFMQQ